MRNPGTASDKGFCRGYLSGVITRHEPHQHVGVNGSHVAS